MNNPILLKTVSAIAFIISGLFTIILMTSGTVGILAFTLTIGMAVVLELCKCGFMYEALSNVRLNGAIRLVMGIISALLVATSIFASAGYVQNQANKTKNIDMKDSTQYKQLEQGKAVQQDLYNTTKKEIEDLKALQQKQQATGDNIVNSMPKDYITRKNEQRTKTQNQVADTQKLINEKQSQLSTLGGSLQNPIDTANLKINSDNGYTAMFQKLAELLNSSEEYKSNPVKAESLEMWFFIGLGVIFELVAVLCAYLSQLKGNSIAGAGTKIEVVKDSGIGFKKPQVVTATGKSENDISLIGDFYQEEKPKRPIGFYQEPMTASMTNDKNNGIVESPKPCATHNVHEIDNKILGIYLDYVYSNVKPDNSIPGYQITAKELNSLHDLSLGVDYIRKLKNHAEQLKILESDSVARKTFIIKPRNEVKL